jgi:hypothetical protein
MPAGVTAATTNRRGLDLFRDYERTGNLQLLQEAITLFRDAAGATPAGHPHRPERVSDLDLALKIRLERTGHKPS